MADTRIEWAEKSWNITTGCSPVSEGCQNCYAKRMANRLRGRYGYPADDPFRVTFHPERLKEPLRWQKPSRIFVVSMGDLFHEDVPWKDIDTIFWIIYQCKQHTFLILTKRPERMLYYMTPNPNNIGTDDPPFWPLPNVWLGVTIESPEYLWRADVLRQIPAAKRFISYEPALEPLGEVDLTGIDWIICGSESGPKRRPAKVEWIRDLKDQCVDASVPFFLKQMEINGKIVKMPELDGWIWNEYPEANS